VTIFVQHILGILIIRASENTVPVIRTCMYIHTYIYIYIYVYIKNGTCRYIFCASEQNTAKKPEQHIIKKKPVPRNTVLTISTRSSPDHRRSALPQPCRENTAPWELRLHKCTRNCQRTGPLQTPLPTVQDNMRIFCFQTPHVTVATVLGQTMSGLHP
jgi:hypothetical protein